MTKEPSLSGLRGVALLEAAKGALVLLVGCGLLGLIHRNVQDLAEQFVQHLHLNPAKGYPHIFIDAAARLTDARLWLLAGLALSYTAARAVEAYGLWHQRRWAEWLGLLTGGVYLFFEVYELDRGTTWIKAAALVINLLVVGYLAYALYRSHHPRQPPS